MGIRSRNQVSAEFSSASISDIVFLLLIYFMLTSSFVKQSSIKIELPAGSSEKSSEGKNYVTVSSDGIYAWNQIKVDSREDLIPYLEEIFEDNDPENDIVTLRVDKQAVFEDAAFVIDKVAKYGGKVFILYKK
ncbi:MAG: biopolymer transporter ExbD [Bacteroidota bacterium]